MTKPKEYDWADQLVEQLRPKICAEQVEWFSFAHLSAALREVYNRGKLDALRDKARIERGEDD